MQISLVMSLLAKNNNGITYDRRCSPQVMRGTVESGGGLQKADDTFTGGVVFLSLVAEPGQKIGRSSLAPSLPRFQDISAAHNPAHCDENKHETILQSATSPTLS